MSLIQEIKMTKMLAEGRLSFWAAGTTALARQLRYPHDARPGRIHADF